ncbi:hypothetical protein SUGI_0183240 [Cryptomeria japonica]|uniref:uncharacterized zinc finger CCHC domain-containing protein At4g19190 n=1 Tax=Cryptomeria japonica TaxID=3369 RepID=UPI002408A0FE|nr:uncharacterized zinc finger CCHC domain-containing protein At4g19190 [Cryptomeria japonica]GLJ12068.1 hypothetical protein SUGI_0183240 [Cryptomeria japonica]
MEGEKEGGLRLSKRIAQGEVDYSSKSGTAWSHSYLNQKPWHPLSYPNQKRKWIAEQTHAQKERRSQEVAREFAQEQDFFRQTAAISKKEKEKVEVMKAVSFMYMRPPGYNAESAKAAEIADERKKLGVNNDQEDSIPSASGGGGKGHIVAKDGLTEEKRKSQPKDIFGRPLPTEEEFEVLKNAPRLETGLPVRVKPFGVEIRNVRCVRCGTYGHQSGDRDCLLRDMIMPNEESRLKRDDPLTKIIAHTASDEPLKWELKQQPGGISPPRGGYKLDDPNQQIIPDEIFDEYGGFLSGGVDIPELLTNFSKEKSKRSKSRKKESRHRKLHGAAYETSSDDGGKHSSHTKIKHGDRKRKRSRYKNKSKKRHHSISSRVSSPESDRRHKKQKRKKKHESGSSTSSSESERRRKKQKRRKQHKSGSSTSSSDSE